MNFTHDSIKKLIGSKSVYIYAVNLEGTGIYKLFNSIGIDVKGFIDSRKFDDNKKMGKPIIDPEAFFHENIENADQVFIVIATKHRKTKRKAIQECEKLGLVKNISYVIVTDLCDYLPTVEVVGACNLNCISCEVGSPDSIKKGFMSPETYHKIIVKMRREIPFMNSICLYLWGSPLCTRNCPKFLI